ncbi:Os12g0434601, partial [Oryza sativa Japonica Group]
SLLYLAKKRAFDILLLSDMSLIISTEAEDYALLNASLVVLFADAVKGSLLSTNIYSANKDIGIDLPFTVIC